MKELQELREKIESQDYQGALAIINELEEMSVEDKLNKIYSYMVVLLTHLIKQEVEKRTTSSWERSIFNSVKYIKKTNKRNGHLTLPRKPRKACPRRAGGYYATPELLQEIVDEAFDHALIEASYEAFEGKMDVEKLNDLVKASEIKAKARALIEE